MPLILKQVIFYISLSVIIILVLYLAYYTGHTQKYKKQLKEYEEHIEICKTQNAYLVNGTTYSCNLLKPPEK